MTENDKKWGPFTLGRWTKYFSLILESGDDEDPGNYIRAIAFGWALKCKLPQIIKPAGKYGDQERRYGFTLSDQGGGYDFFQVFYGANSYCSNENKMWCCHLPWKMSRMIRHSLYHADGTLAAEGGEKTPFDFYWDAKETLRKTHFEFEDYDGEKIIATCHIEEREWARGEGWFKWLDLFYPRFIRRVLDMEFSSETGTEKGSWKGGTTGTSIDMTKNETAESAFRRYCEETHKAKYRTYKVSYVGPCGPPVPKPIAEAPIDDGINAVAMA